MGNFYNKHKTTILVVVIIVSIIGNFIVGSRTWFKNFSFGLGRSVIDVLPEDLSGLFGQETSFVQLLPDIPKSLNTTILRNPQFLTLENLPPLEEIRSSSVFFPDDSLTQFGDVIIVNSGIGDSLIINWQTLESTFLEKIIIYRSDAFGELGAKVTDVSGGAHSWRDTGVEANKIYFYTLRGVSSNGVESNNMYQYPGLAIDLDPPPSPTDLRLVAAVSREVEINWNNPSVEDFAFARIYRSTLPGQTGKLIADKIYGSEYVDTDITPGVEYFYTVTAVDLSLNESPRKTSPALARRLFDNLAVLGQGDILLLLRGVEVENIGSGTAISLKWQNPDDERFDRVRIYRSMTFKELGELIADMPKEIESFIDNNVEKERVYYYTLRTVDTLDRESDNTIQYLGVARDTLGPGIPRDLTLEQTVAGTVTLSWSPPQDADLDYYRVYRSLRAGETGCLVSDRVTEESWEDIIKDNIIYYYTVTAVDTSGNESAKPLPSVIRGGRVPFLTTASEETEGVSGEDLTTIPPLF